MDRRPACRFSIQNNQTGGTPVPLFRSRLSDPRQHRDAVHNVADMDGINAIGRDHGLDVVEDSAQAHLAEYKGKKVIKKSEDEVLDI